MKIPKRQLRKIILEEFAATAAEEAAKVNKDLGDTPGAPGSLSEDQAYWEKWGIVTGEDLAIDLVASTYSDMHKSIYGFRPRGEFKTYEDVKIALEDLERYYEDMIEQDEIDARARAEYEKNRKELEALMPTPLEKQYSKFSKHSGMGRRHEAINHLKRIIKEELKREVSRRKR